MQFEASKVNKIYLGRDRICRCGCAGEYVERGEPKFEKRLKRFARMWSEYTPSIVPYCEDVTNDFMNISYGKDRALTVYFD